MSATMATKTIKIALIAIIIVTVSITIGYYVGKRQITSIKEAVNEVEKDAAISMDNIHQEETRDGKKEWMLDAASVEYNIPKKQAVFKDISLVYFLKDGKKIYLTAKNGILHRESKDIEIYGDVFVKNEDYKLRTETLFLDNKTRKISSRAPVKIYDGSSILNAQSMSIDLNTNNLTFSGVRGEFTGDMSF